VFRLMGRLWRFLLIAVVALAALAPATAFAGCSSDPTAPGCLPTPPPGTPTPPKTPTPTAKPTTKPVATTAPTHHFVPAPVNNTGSTTVDNSTPEPTPFPVDSVSPGPVATTVIETQTLPGDNATTLNATDSGAASNWIFGFIVGLLIGLLVGRASWGIKRRRRQQIFG
jgi:hypothetical protein